MAPTGMDRPCASTKLCFRRIDASARSVLSAGLAPDERKGICLYEFTDNHDYDYTIPAEGRSLLASLPGRKLVSIGGYRYDLTPVEGKTTFYAVARLNMEDGESYDLRVRPVRVDIAADFWDDAGAYSFGRSEGNIWLPEGGSRPSSSSSAARSMACPSSMITT